MLISHLICFFLAEKKKTKPNESTENQKTELVLSHLGLNLIFWKEADTKVPRLSLSLLQQQGFLFLLHNFELSSRILHDENSCQNSCYKTKNVENNLKNRHPFLFLSGCICQFPYKNPSTNTHQKTNIKLSEQ